jgi:probable rRNA maturation factor
MIYVNIKASYKDKVAKDLLENAAAAALKNQKVDPNEVDLSVVVEGNKKLQELNKQFFDIDAPTDVLSFPSEEVDPETGMRYIGDVIISYPRTKSQAVQEKHSIEDELQLLTVHGVLHLLGFDHANPQEKEIMWGFQNGILKQLGCNIEI